MKFSNLAAALALASVVASSTPSIAMAQITAKPAPKVSMERAKAIALHARPGRIVASELEAEKGGSGLRYSFDIKTGAKTHEVGVDAQSGVILENIVEGKNPD